MDFLHHPDHESHANQLKRKRITSPAQDSAASLSAHPPNNHLHHHPHHHHPQSQHKPASPAPSNQHLTINYLARLRSEDLPLVSNDDNLQTILRLVGDYHGVLDRHESLACNLGARSLGPILIKRFERLFDAPPRILANHGKDAAHVTWLDVAEFARSKPDHFSTEQDHSGQQVRQFWTKSCHVQINEEDYMLLSSGIPQKMIPPQPIVEDEEKELGTLEILEKNLNGLVSLADQVAAKGRQLNHRIRSRKQAILDRRASDAEISYTTAHQPNSSAVTNFNNVNPPTANSPLGFVAVNSRQHTDAHAELSRNGASSATHNELLSKFFTTSDKCTRSAAPAATPAIEREGAHTPANMPTRQSLAANFAAMHSQHNSSSHIDFPTTDSFAPNQAMAQAAALSALGIPSSLANFPPGASSGPQHTQPSTPSASAAPHFPTSHQQANHTPAKDEGPYKPQMVQRMEQLKKGDPIYPPCDRCRRLHMDCTKNLTACTGCTKKHAKCSWRDVLEGEIVNMPPAVSGSGIDGQASDGYMAAPSAPSLERKDSGGSKDNANGNGSHDRGHPYFNLGTPTTNGGKGRNSSKPRPISSRSSSGNGFMPSLLNPEEPAQSNSSAAAHESHEIHSPLDPVAAASLAAAAHAASVTHHMTNGERERNGDVQMASCEKNGYKQDIQENGTAVDRRERDGPRDKALGNVVPSA